MLDYIIVLIGLIWLLIASISDIKTKEVPNWLNFSLVLIAFGIYGFKSILISSAKPVLGSLLGFAIFFVIGSLMYYSKQWGGGDAKLLYGLGALFHEYPSQLNNLFNANINLPFLAILFLNLVIFGSLYGILISITIMVKERKKFTKNFKGLFIKTKTVSFTLLVLAVLLIILSLILSIESSILIVLILAAIFPVIFFQLFLAVKAVENISMYKKIKTFKLVEGDWIAEKIKVDNKLIYDPKRSAGVTKKQIALIKKHKREVLIKEGIAFVPPFFIAAIVSLIFGNWLF